MIELVLKLSVDILTENISDWVIAIAYFSIPLQLVWFLFKFPLGLDYKHKLIISLFAAFILLCGTTHAVHAIHQLQIKQFNADHSHAAATLAPDQLPSGIQFVARLLLWTKIFTAIISLVTCLVLCVLIPTILGHVNYVGELEASMRDKIVELDEARAIAEQANVRKGEFMAFLCHEIRNPLHVITANIDFLLESSNMCPGSGSGSGSTSVHDPTGTPMLMERDVSAASSSDLISRPDDGQNLQRSNTSSTPSTACVTSTSSPNTSDTSIFASPWSSAPSRPNNSLLFNIPSIPTSASHSRAGSTIIDIAQLAQQQNIALLQSDPLLASNLYPLHHVHEGSLDSGMGSPNKHHGLTPNTPSKRRTWPSVRPSSQVASSSYSHNTSPPAQLSLEQRQYLTSINHAAELMVSICNDVLDIAKLESGVIVFEHIAVDLPLLCETFINLCRPQAKAKNMTISLIWDSPPLSTRYVFCDPTRLHQVFLQIISNAIKFSRDETTNNSNEPGRDPSSPTSSSGLLTTTTTERDHRVHQLSTSRPPNYESSQPIPPPSAFTFLTSSASSSPRLSDRSPVHTPTFPPRLASGFGAGGQIEFRVRTYTPTKAELEALGLSTSETHVHSRSSPPSSSHTPSWTNSAIPRDRHLSSSASPPTVSTDTLSTIPPYATSRLHHQTHSTTHRPTIPTSASVPPHTRSLNPSVPLLEPRVVKSSSGKHLSLAGVGYSPRPTQSVRVRKSLPPTTYGTRTSSSDESTSSGHNTDGEDEATSNDEQRRLIPVGTLSSSSHVQLSSVSNSPNQVSSPVTPFDGYQASHRIAIDSTPDTISAPPLVDDGNVTQSKLSAADFMWLEFLISDNGVGMSDQALQHIFTPYSESKLKTYRSKGGTGLGLSICKEVVTQLGGEMIVTSVEGEGTIFIVRLHLQIAQATDVLETYSSRPIQTTTHGLDASTNTTEPSTSYSSRRTSATSTISSMASSAIGAPVQVGSTQLYATVIPTTSSPQFGGLSRESSASLPPTDPMETILLPTPTTTLGIESPFPTTNPIKEEPLPTRLHLAPSELSGLAPSTTLATTTIAAGSLPSIAPPPPSASPRPIIPPVQTTSASLDSTFSSTSSSPHQTVPTSSVHSSPSIQSYPSTPTMSSVSSLSLTGSPVVAPYRILVVDDNDINRKLLSRMMKSLTYEVDTAEDGSQAVEAVKKNMATYPPPTILTQIVEGTTSVESLTEDERNKLLEYERNRYSIIIMDISMPVMDGYEATIAIRKLGFTAPIIALTANALTEERSKAFESGMNEFCTKPIRKHELVALMKHFCGHDPMHLVTSISNSPQSSTSATSTPQATPHATPPQSLLLTPIARQRSTPSPNPPLLPAHGGSLLSTQPYASSINQHASSTTSSGRSSGELIPPDRRLSGSGTEIGSFHSGGALPPLPGFNHRSTSAANAPLMSPPIRSSRDVSHPSPNTAFSNSSASSTSSNHSLPPSHHHHHPAHQRGHGHTAAHLTQSTNPPLVLSPSAGSMNLRRAAAQHQHQVTPIPQTQTESERQSPESIENSPPPPPPERSLYSPTRRALMAQDPPLPPQSLLSLDLLSGTDASLSNSTVSSAVDTASMSPRSSPTSKGHTRTRSRGAIIVSPDGGNLLSTIAAAQQQQQQQLQSSPHSTSRVLGSGFLSANEGPLEQVHEGGESCQATPNPDRP